MSAAPARPDAGWEHLRDDVLRGLRGSPRTLPSYLFLDERGAELAIRISELPEYYPTRAEVEILRLRSAELADLLGSRVALFEYGGPSGVRSDLLLEALDHPVAYIPVGPRATDATPLAAEHPELVVIPIRADYATPFALPALPGNVRRVAFIPGSAIGMMHPAEAAAFLRRVRSVVGPFGAIVLGADLRKDPLVLHAAYNDSAGVTAAYNLNTLSRLDRELGADFDVTRFRHYAFYEPVTGRVELHLVSLTGQTVTVAGEQFRFARGDTIWTQSAYKYGTTELESLAGAAGFTVTQSWVDGGEGFAVLLME
jgi:dimethylhistidine N-methyltransferase